MIISNISSLCVCKYCNEKGAYTHLEQHIFMIRSYCLCEKHELAKKNNLLLKAVGLDLKSI
jgi:hypothetical protein